MKIGEVLKLNSFLILQQENSATKSGDSGDSAVATMPRKLTRSLSARVSRLATVSRPTNTDTDSEVDEKSSDNKK